MYGKIKFVKNIHRKLLYHENKVRKGHAECLYAGNFVKDLPNLSVEDKQFHFERLHSRNERAKKATGHLFLGFYDSDHLSNEQMTHIVREYLTEMKLEDRPYLIYRHHDNFHPHAHVLYAAMQEDGKRMVMNLRDYYHSSRVIMDLNEKYGLEHNAGKHHKVERPSATPKISYGDMPLYLSMSKVLETVVPHYQYTSIEELNAILQLYNMRAEKANKGLIYRPLGNEGQRQPTYIKSSHFDYPVTLKDLEERFAVNLAQRDQHRLHLTSPIDWALNSKPLSFEAFKKQLATEQISVVDQRDKGGSLQNIWYIDHSSKAVFNGTTLGEAYNAAAISRRCIPEETYQLQQQQQLAERQRQRLSHHW